MPNIIINIANIGICKVPFAILYIAIIQANVLNMTKNTFHPLLLLAYIPAIITNIDNITVGTAISINAEFNI